MPKSQSQTKKISIQNFAIFIVAFLVIGMMFGQIAGQVYTGISATGSDTVELTNNGNLDTKVRDFSLASVGGVNGNTLYKMITLNPTAGAYSDFWVKKTVLYLSGMQPDFDDVRFTTLGGVNVPYWIETKVDSDTADVWLQVPETSVTESMSIEQSYGNSGATSVSDSSGLTYTNVMSSATVLNSANSGGMDLTKARDGAVVLNCWYTLDDTGGSIGYDFSSAKTVTKIRFYSFAVTERVKSFTVQRYDSGFWTKVPILSVAGNAVLINTDEGQASNVNGWNEVVIQSTTDTKFRLMFTDTWNIGDNNAGIAELEMYVYADSPTVPTWGTDGVEQSVNVVDPGVAVGDDKLYYDGTLSSTLTYSDGSAYIDSSSVSADMKGSLPIIKVDTTQNIKIDHGLQYSITYVPKNMDVSSPNMFNAGEDLTVNTRLTDTSGNPVSNQPLEMRVRLFDREDDRYLDEIVGSTSFVIPGKYIKSGKHYQLRISYEGYEFGGWSNEILADFDVGTEGFTITSSPDKAPEGVMAASIAAASNLVGMAVTGWLDIPIIGDIIKFVADFVGVTL